MSTVIDGPLIYWPLAPGEVEKLPDPREVVSRVPCARCDGMGCVDRQVGRELSVTVCPSCNGRLFVEVTTR